jgi:hypothetical protein
MSASVAPVGYFATGGVRRTLTDKREQFTSEVEASGNWQSLVPQNLAAEDINDPAFAGLGRN